MRSRPAISCSMLFLLGAAVSGFAPAAGTDTAPAARQVAVLGEEFYIARARFDPLNYATANGDSRFDDQIDMSIAPKIRAAYFAHMHRLALHLGYPGAGRLPADLRRSQPATAQVLPRPAEGEARSAAGTGVDPRHGERARQALGDKFTYAAFHDVVIGDGTLPLPILEARVDAWIGRLEQS